MKELWNLFKQWTKNDIHKQNNELPTPTQLQNNVDKYFGLTCNRCLTTNFLFTNFPIFKYSGFCRIRNSKNP